MKGYKLLTCLLQIGSHKSIFQHRGKAELRTTGYTAQT